MANKKSQKPYRVLTLSVLPRHLDWAQGVLYQEGIFTLEEKKTRQQILLKFELPNSLSFPKLQKKLSRIQDEKGKSLFQSFELKTHRDRSWNEEYLKYLQPFPLYASADLKNPVLWIDPRGELPTQKNDDTLYLNPGLAFGTGTHPTTRLVGELLVDVISQMKRPPTHVLDLGCGTGILAMIAKRLKAKSILAVDNDPVALEVAEENFTINQIQKIKLQQSLKGVRKKFDLIVANILLNTLLELKTEILTHLSSNGLLILSGLLYKDVPPILKAYRPLKLMERKNRKGWTALVMG